MKIQELLNDKGLELTKGKVLDSDVFKFGGSDVHVIYIADTQTLIDKFKMDVIRPGVPLEFVPTTKESYEGDPVAKFELDDFARSANKGVCSVKGCDKPSTQFGLCEEHFKKIY